MELVILGGGVGTRLWPLSRASFPKQFLKPLGSTRSFLGCTRNRFQELLGDKAPHVVLGEKYRALALLENPDMPIISEPVKRGTAAASFLAVKYLEAAGCAGDEAVILTPADHLMQEEDRFREVVRDALARLSESLVLLGIPPSFPATEYGYLCVDSESGLLKRFVEKPTLEVAQGFLATEGYLWNSGITIGRLEVFLRAFATAGFPVQRGYRELLETYDQLPQGSLDHLILENETTLAYHEIKNPWSDMGNWDSQYRWIQSQTQESNLANGPAYFRESSGNLVVSQVPSVLLGVKDLVVIQSVDTLLVAPRADVGLLQDFLASAEVGKLAQEVLFLQESWGQRRLIALYDAYRFEEWSIQAGAERPDPAAYKALSVAELTKTRWLVCLPAKRGEAVFFS